MFVPLCSFDGEKKSLEVYGPAGVRPAAADDDDDDDDVDLFGSDDEEDEEAERIKQERLAAYAEKKSKSTCGDLADVDSWMDECFSSFYSLPRRCTCPDPPHTHRVPARLMPNYCSIISTRGLCRTLLSGSFEWPQAHQFVCEPSCICL